MKCGHVWAPNNKKRNRLVYIVIHTYKRQVFYIKQHRHTWSRATNESIKHKIKYQIIRVSISQFKKNNHLDEVQLTYKRNDVDRYGKLVATMMTDFLESVLHAMEI